MLSATLLFFFLPRSHTVTQWPIWITHKWLNGAICQNFVENIHNLSKIINSMWNVTARPSPTLLCLWWNTPTVQLHSQLPVQTTRGMSNWANQLTAATVSSYSDCSDYEFDRWPNLTYCTLKKSGINKRQPHLNVRQAELPEVSFTNRKQQANIFTVDWLQLPLCTNTSL